MGDDPPTVYMAQTMREDPDEPVYAERIGETAEAAKREVLDATKIEIPSTVRKIEQRELWEDDHLALNGWIFNVRTFELHG